MNKMKITCRTFLASICVVLLQMTGVSSVYADNSAWMGNLPDNMFVSQLSIPGSHDAGTGHGVNNVYVVVSGSTYATTQEKNLTQQWNSGVRAFDLRPAVDGSSLRIYHGIVSTNLYMDNALSTLCGLLDSHPTETCIVIIRHESEGDDNNSSWGTKMKDLLNSNPTKSHAVNFDPMAKLGDVRGKIIILSRDNYDTNPVGGYITGWGFSADFNSQKGGKISGVGTQGPLYVQDYYDVSASGAPATKTSSIQRMLQFSTSENTNPGLWVINQTSGYSKTASVFGNTVATSDGYRDNAQTQNQAAITYINSHPGPTGIVLMDFAGEDASNGYNVKGQALTNAIIASNSKTGQNTEYFRALGDITPGGQYCITTTYNGTKYYLKTDGYLTSEEVDAGIFTFSRVEGATYTYGFNLQNAYFTNPSQTNGSVTYNSGHINTNTSSKRKDWEAQVFFKNTAGKYAIRATNANGTGNWESASKAYWTVNSGTSGPVAEYSASMNYVWNVEEPSPYVTVTFNLYFSSKKVGEVTAVCERGSDSALPEEYINDFCTYTYSPKTITSSTVRVTVRWPSSGPFKVSTQTGTRNWYNLKAGRLGRYFGWEDREPYHPHAYDDASVEQYPETELYATELVRASDAYQWAFVGNPVEGFKIVNKLMGEDYSLTVDGTATSAQGVSGVKNAVLREGDFRWTVYANNDGFSLCLKGQENHYINTHGGPHGYLQIWETAAAKTDLGSRLLAEAVPAASVPMTAIGEGYYTTLCLPYDVTVNDAKVYILEKREGEDEEEGLILPIFDKVVPGNKALAPAYNSIDADDVLLTLVDNTVPAGTPVVLWGESETATLTYGNSFVTQPSTETALSGLFLPANPASVLTLQGVEDVPGFYAFDGETVEANQAYLKLRDPSIQALKLRFSDVEDGIKEVESSRQEAGSPVYDLSGRQLPNGRLSNSQMLKGIYIVNGKKVIR